MLKNIFLIIISLICFVDVAISQDDLLPRFVFLKSSKVNMRAGPGERFPIEWVYKIKGLPFEVIDSFEDWYKVKDIEGSSGWVYKRMLSTKADYAMVKGNDAVFFQKDSLNSRVLGYFEDANVVRVIRCEKQSAFCLIQYGDDKGYVQKIDLFGILEDEEGN